jgi:plasmid stability protein
VFPVMPNDTARKPRRLDVDLDPQLHEALHATARSNYRSVSAEVRKALTDHIAREQAPGAAERLLEATAD